MGGGESKAGASPRLQSTAVLLGVSRASKGGVREWLLPSSGEAMTWRAACGASRADCRQVLRQCPHPQTERGQHTDCSDSSRPQIQAIVYNLSDPNLA